MLKYMENIYEIKQIRKNVCYIKNDVMYGKWAFPTAKPDWTITYADKVNKKVLKEILTETQNYKTNLSSSQENLHEKYPDYLAAWDRIMKRTDGYRFNMCIMRRNLMDAYCAWLFDILFEVEKRLDISNYSAYDARVFGFISERLLDVWVEKNQPPVKVLPVVNLESQHWGKKIWNFLLRKLSGGKLGKTK